MAQVHESTSQVVDTLRMSERDLLRVLGQLADAANERCLREHACCTVVPNYPRALVRLRDQTSGSWFTSLVKPRAVHQYGMTFLHGGYVHRDVRCGVLLRDAKGQAAQLGATVTMCRHVSGRIHEVVVTFDQPIELRAFSFADGCMLSSPSLWHNAQVQG